LVKTAQNNTSYKMTCVYFWSLTVVSLCNWYRLFSVGDIHRWKLL